MCKFKKRISYLEREKELLSEIRDLLIEVNTLRRERNYTPVTIPWTIPTLPTQVDYPTYPFTLSTGTAAVSARLDDSSNKIDTVSSESIEVIDKSNIVVEKK